MLIMQLSGTVFLVLLLLVEIQCSNTQNSDLNLNCGVVKRKDRVRRLYFHQSEECFYSSKIYCRLIPSLYLRRLQLVENTAQESVEFPVNTWRDGEMYMSLDRNEISFKPNSSEYKFSLPVEFYAFGGTVDVYCLPYFTEPTDKPTLQTTAPASEALLSSLQIAIIASAASILLVGTLILIVCLVRRRSQVSGKAKTSQPKQHNRSSVSNDYSAPTSFGVAVYIDPNAPNDYDNKEQPLQKQSSGEYSYSYTGGIKSAPKLPGPGAYSYSYMDQVLAARKPAQGEYSYTYMDQASAIKDQDYVKEQPVNRQISERPYDDVEVNNPYSYTYSGVVKT